MSEAHNLVYADNVEALRNALRRGVNVETENKAGVTPLMLAAWLGRRECARLLIEYGANVNFQDGAGESALFKAIVRGHAQMVRLLIDYGAVLNQINWEGQTPLDVARATGRRDIILLLQEAGQKLKKPASEPPVKKAPAESIATKNQQLLNEMRKRKRPRGPL